MADRMIVREQRTEDGRQHLPLQGGEHQRGGNWDGDRVIKLLHTFTPIPTLTPPLKARGLLARFLVFCLLSSVFCPLMAEDLPDPTRPPASIFTPVGGTGVTHEMPAENHARGLHTIIISETRRAAIIDGQTVELGEEHGGARLIEVNEGGVILERGQSRHVLTLFPDIKITRKKKPVKE